MAAQQHQIQLSLPPKALEEMRQMAHDRLLQEATADIPSPRGAAELFNFHEAAAADDGAGDTVRSNDGVVEPKAQQVSNNDIINQMTCTFLSDIIQSSVTMTEHCFRTTIQPADLAKAKELFAAAKNNNNNDDDDEDDDEDWAEKDEIEEKMDEEEDRDDDTLIYYDGSDNEEETTTNTNDNDDDDDIYIDQEKYPQSNTTTPTFDKSYPPVVGEKIVHLTNTQFREQILIPLIRDVTKNNSDIPLLGEGVDGMFKRAVYAFVVATLCALSRVKKN